jgi:hypothetical protein
MKKGIFITFEGRGGGGKKHADTEGCFFYQKKRPVRGDAP